METKLYKTVLENMNEKVYIRDLDKNILYINKASERFTGWSSQEALGRKCYEVFGDKGLTCKDLCPVEKAISQRVPILHHEGKMVTRSGEERDMQTSASPIYEGESVTAAVVATQDMTHLKELEQTHVKTLMALEKEVEERKKAEEGVLRAQKFESIGVLAGGFAHDFNNLLTAILGFIDLSKDYAEPGCEIFEHLSEAESASMEAKDLIKRFITFAGGGMPVKRIGPLVNLIKDSTKLSLSGSNIGCELSIPDDLWAVEFDDDQMRQVVNALTANAKEAMPEGGIIKVAAENISLGQGKKKPVVQLRDGRYIKISIQDQGDGIPEEHLPKIFDPYFSTKERGVQKGMGMGLATAYSVIIKHNGYIEVDSEVGVGTTIYIYLPASEKEIREPKEVKEERLFMGRGKILFMDDQEMIRNVAGKMLEKLGYEVEFSEGGIEAIGKYKEAKESKKSFDAVIMDLTIPGGMGGKEAVKRLLEIDPEARVIVSSGYLNDPAISNFSKYGFQGSVPKPFKIQELSKALHKIINE